MNYVILREIRCASQIGFSTDHRGATTVDNSAFSNRSGEKFWKRVLYIWVRTKYGVSIRHNTVVDGRIRLVFAPTKSCFSREHDRSEKRIYAESDRVIRSLHRALQLPNPPVKTTHLRRSVQSFDPVRPFRYRFLARFTRYSKRIRKDRLCCVARSRIVWNYLFI